MTSIDVRPLRPTEHLAFLQDRPFPQLGEGVSFLQTPAWGEVKSDWRSESVGWFRGGTLVGAGLVLHRPLPAVARTLAYLPEGPVLDWSDPDLPRLLSALAGYLRGRGAFGVRMGPPVVVRTWTAATVKKAMSDGVHRRLGDVPPDTRPDLGSVVTRTLRDCGWRAPASEEGFAAGQPRYVFQVRLAGRDEAAVLAGMNQQWRRNIKRAAQSGVEVTCGDANDLAEFHRLYLETARRDGFTPRPLGYFQRMFAALRAECRDRIRLYLARHEGDLVAATTAVRVGGHVWYSYGASSTGKREVRGSNAVQWQMMRDALAAGADVYDLRGITDTLDPGDPHVGLIQFKVGTGGSAVEYAGEWDLPLRRLLYKGFDAYLRRRQATR